MRNRQLAYIGVAAIASVLAIAAREQTSTADAVREAGPAATSLGFRLTDSPDPAVSGSDMWGTRSFHWKFLGADGVTNLLAYLVADNTLCWTSVHGDSVTYHGCVVVSKDRS